MADYTVANISGRGYATDRQHASWSAIFGGTFVFIAIMATFLALGEAIFASTNSVQGGVPGVSTGMAIWTAVLTIIALAIAGLATGRLSDATTRSRGMWEGMVTFGMCILTAVLVSGIAFSAAAVEPQAANPPMNVRTLGNVLAPTSWGLFLALLIGGILCTWAAASAVQRPSAPAERPQIRTVA